MLSAKRKPVRLLYQVTAIFLALLLLAGCSFSFEGSFSGEETFDGEDNLGSDNPSAGNPGSKPTSNASESYTNFIQAKGALLESLTDALSENPDTQMYSMSFLGVALLDLMMIPATSFGLGEEAAIMTLGFMGIDDVEYSEFGNTYYVKYTGNDDKVYEMEGEYDQAADALKCTIKTDGKESLISEHRKTSYGYVGQFFSYNNDGTTYLYQISVSNDGKDGMFGISTSATEPPVLTGSESIDFPKQCEEWYEIKNNQVAGHASDGTDFAFTYVPSEE